MRSAASRLASPLPHSGVMDSVRVLLLAADQFLSPPSPRLPRHRSIGRAAGASLTIHAAVLLAAIVVSVAGIAAPLPDLASSITCRRPPTMIFMVDSRKRGGGGGGGGGGNREQAPVSRLQRRGSEAITRPASIAPSASYAPTEDTSAVVLDAKAFASDSTNHVGLADGVLQDSPSRGSGLGGGVGTGTGTGIGAGQDPGLDSAMAAEWAAGFTVLEAALARRLCSAK